MFDFAGRLGFQELEIPLNVQTMEGEHLKKSGIVRNAENVKNESIVTQRSSFKIQ